MTLIKVDLMEVSIEYLAYFEGDKSNKSKASILMDIFTKYCEFTDVLCKKPRKELPFIYSVFDSMVDTVLFDNGNKVLDPKDRDSLISYIQEYNEHIDIDVMAKALAITTINRFYNSFRT